MDQATVIVWDRFVRVFHWSLAGSFLVAWLSAEEIRDLHEWAGYVAAALVVCRIVWGGIGSTHARFSDFVRSPRSTLRYLRAMRDGAEHRYLGHNPAGGAMVIGLLVMILLVSLTGWLYTTDQFWGVEWVEEVHETLANVLLVMVILHIAGVLLASYRHHENLVRAMLSGRKRLD